VRAQAGVAASHAYEIGRGPAVALPVFFCPQENEAVAITEKLFIFQYHNAASSKNEDNMIRSIEIFWSKQTALLCCLFLSVSYSFAAKAAKIIDGLDEPVCIADAPGDSTKLFIVERKGLIRIVDLTDNTLLEQPLLNISKKIETGFNEQGLLGLAFPKDWQKSKHFFVNYTRDSDGATVVARYSLNEGSLTADPSSELILLVIDQPYVNHNGGGIIFGPDGYLYIGMGDGGSAGDPQDNAQNMNSQLGKMLRMEVASENITAPEIFLFGLRNPWRFDFDPENNDLYIADVGQNHYEEVHVIPGNSPRNNNLGWNKMEGQHCFPIGSDDCNPDDYDLPVWEYSHRDGCSITGGVVVRDLNVSELYGYYLCADYCSGKVWCFRSAGGGIAGLRELSTEIFGSSKNAENISSFGRDASGRVYICRHLAGELYRLETTLAGPPIR